MSGLREVGDFAAEDEKLSRLAWMRREKTRCTGKTRQKKGANSRERVEQAGTVTMSKGGVVEWDGNRGGDTITTDIKLCSKKSRHGQTYRHLAYAQETNDRNKQNCPGKHRIGSLSMTRDRAYCPAILTSVAKERSAQ